MMFLHKMSYDAAALQCCLIGMKLAEFDTNDVYDDFFSVAASNGGQWTSIGATFSNGDGTDSWCNSFQPIPTNIIKNPFDAYENCQNEKITHRLVIDGYKVSIIVKPHTLVSTNIVACKDT
jgi:hypothetical protein